MVSYAVMRVTYARLGRSPPARRRSRSGRPRPDRADPATVIIPAGSTGVPGGRELGELGRRQDLVRLGDAREPRREVDGAAGVVVAFEQDHRAAGHARVHSSGSSSSCVSCSSLHTAATSCVGLDRHEHAAVAEPLRDAHAEVGRDLAHRAAEQREHPHRLVVAELVAERREPERSTNANHRSTRTTASLVTAARDRQSSRNESRRTDTRPRPRRATASARRARSTSAA